MGSSSSMKPETLESNPLPQETTEIVKMPANSSDKLDSNENEESTVLENVEEIPDIELPEPELPLKPKPDLEIEEVKKQTATFWDSVVTKLKGPTLFCHKCDLREASIVIMSCNHLQNVYIRRSRDFMEKRMVCSYCREINGVKEKKSTPRTLYCKACLAKDCMEGKVDHLEQLVKIISDDDSTSDSDIEEDEDSESDSETVTDSITKDIRIKFGVAKKEKKKKTEKENS